MENEIASGVFQKFIKMSIPLRRSPFLLINDQNGLILDKNWLKQLKEEYIIIFYENDLIFRAEIEKYRLMYDLNEALERKICVVSRQDNSKIQDIVSRCGRNEVTVTPKNLLESFTKLKWHRIINILEGRVFWDNFEQLIEYRGNANEPVTQPKYYDIIISALAKTNLLNDLTPKEAFLFLYPENRAKSIQTKSPTLYERLTSKLVATDRNLAQIFEKVLESDFNHQSFPELLWLSKIIMDFGKNPKTYIRSIFPSLFTQFDVESLKFEDFGRLCDNLLSDRSLRKLCQDQLTQLETRLDNSQAAKMQFRRVSKIDGTNELEALSELIEKDQYTKINFEKTVKRVSNYLVKYPSSYLREEITIIQNSLQNHLFSHQFQEEIILIQHITNFLKLSNELEAEDIQKLNSVEMWTKIYLSKIVPFQIAYAEVESNRSFRYLTRDNRNKLKEIYTSLIWEYNQKFAKFLTKNYPIWIRDTKELILAKDFIKKIFMPEKARYRKIFIVIFDCMRWDIWELFKEKFEQKFEIKTIPALAMLPTTTIYSRSSIFSGRLPRDTLIFPNEGKPQKKKNEVRLISECLGIPSSQIDFCSQSDSDVKIDAVDKVLFSPNQVKILIFNNIDNLIHQYNGSEGNLRRLFLTTYETLIDSLIKEIEKEESSILFILSDHGFVRTTREMKVGRYKGFIHDRCIALDEGEHLTDREVIEINVKDFGIMDNNSRNVAFPIGNLSFRHSDKMTVDPLFRLRSHYCYSHGGLSLQEVLVPFSILLPRKELKIIPLSVDLSQVQGKQYIINKSTYIPIKIQNLNNSAVENIRIELIGQSTTNIPVIGSKEKIEVKMRFQPQELGRIKLIFDFEYSILSQMKKTSSYCTAKVIEDPRKVKRSVDEILDSFI
ncbi:MAG: PglZ domain-containing protein [Candidatus Heimdallarchaeota archaeon]